MKALVLASCISACAACGGSISPGEPPAVTTPQPNKTDDPQQQRFDGIGTPGRFFVSSLHTLFLLDTKSLQLSKVLDFKLAMATQVITEIAIDARGRVYALSSPLLYRVERDGSLTLLETNATDISGIAFALYQGDWRLIGVTDGGELVTLDTESSARATITQLPQGLGRYSAITVVEGKLYTTAWQSGQPHRISFVEVDPDTKKSRVVGPIGQFDVDALAYWNSTFYGVSYVGLVSIDRSSGHGSVLRDGDDINKFVEGAAVNPRTPGIGRVQ